MTSINETKTGVEYTYRVDVQEFVTFTADDVPAGMTPIEYAEQLYAVGATDLDGHEIVLHAKTGSTWAPTYDVEFQLIVCDVFRGEGIFIADPWNSGGNCFITETDTARGHFSIFTDGVGVCTLHEGYPYLRDEVDEDNACPSCSTGNDADRWITTFFVDVDKGEYDLQTPWAIRNLSDATRLVASCYMFLNDEDAMNAEFESHGVAGIDIVRDVLSWVARYLNAGN